jgi:AAA+ ATPase superfamily predicted ATPase
MLKCTEEQKTIEEYFAALFRMSKQHPVLLVLDEFQDIKFVPQAEGILRSNLQRLTKIPILISGSKRQLLTEMFASAHAPFFSFGDEISLPPIPVSDWHEYFNIRLKAHNKSISMETLGEICERLCHVPNGISEVGFWFRHDENLSGIISSSDAWNSIEGLIQGKQQTYRYHLAPYSSKEKAILHAVAKRTYVSAPNSKDFIKDVISNASSINKSINKFIRLGVLEWELDMEYRISDPLLSLFIAKNPPVS